MSTQMHEAPSLFSLCTKTITMSIIHGCHHMEDVFELPSDLFDGLIMSLPPLALQNIHELYTNGDGGRESRTNCISGEDKDGRFNTIVYEDFISAWKMFFKKRWPENIKSTENVNCVATQDDVGIFKLVNHSVDWQQLYWGKHLQECLNEAAERALLPAFDGHIGELTLPDSIMASIGYGGGITRDYLKVSYHCKKFGFYARCLRLQNVLCVPETCALLRGSKLQSIVFRRITSETHVNGLCMLVNQNRETLVSLELIHCRLSCVTMDQICSSLYQEGTQTHEIQSFTIKSSSSFEWMASSLPAGLLSFLSSGRFLHSLYFCEIRMGPRFARMILDTLCKSSCNLVTLDISDNNISGWLCNLDRRPTNLSLLLGSAASLKSLSVLNLRGNDLSKDDAEDLSHVLVHLPNLRSLDLSDNPLLDDGVRNLTPYFIKALDNAWPLSDIKIENCRLTGDGVAEFLRSIPASKEPLGTLSVSDNDLGSSVAAPLANFLATSRVRVLNIEDIGLGPSGFEELEKGMTNEMALVSINISKNRGGIKAANFISRAIRRAPNLVSIIAGYNIMPLESLDVIHDALKLAKGKLEQLDLTGNSMLHRSAKTLMLLDFCIDGKPIVILPSYAASSMAYDHDP